MKQNVCRKFKYGYCKYLDKCHFKHNKTLCTDKNCSVFNCEKRHPRTCQYYKEYKRCKFTTYCLFKHDIESDTSEIEKKIKENGLKLKEIEKKLKKIESIETKMVSDLDLAKEVDKKMEALKRK